jgi:hypothetical protein
MNRDEKIQRAKEFLGSKYLLHPSRRVKRLNPQALSDTSHQVKGIQNHFKPKPLS